MQRELPRPNKQHVVDLSEDECAELESFVSSGVTRLRISPELGFYSKSTTARLMLRSVAR